jgi:hypothetical protein
VQVYDCINTDVRIYTMSKLIGIYNDYSNDNRTTFINAFVKHTKYVCFVGWRDKKVTQWLINQRLRTNQNRISAFVSFSQWSMWVCKSILSDLDWYFNKQESNISNTKERKKKMGCVKFWADQVVVEYKKEAIVNV